MNKKRLNIMFIIFDIALVLLYIGASWYFSGVLIAFPQRSLAQVAANMQADGYRTDPAEFGLPEPEDVIIPVDEEIQLAGWYFDNPTDGNCGLIFLHGHTGARLHGLIYSEPFWTRGCDLLMFDARHHGESTGEFGTYGFFEKEDTRVALRWFEAKTGLATEQIGLAGVSYGAATVLQAAALEPNIAFVIADSPYQDLATIVREQAVNQYGSLMFLLEPGAFFFAGLRADFRPTQVSPEDAAASIQSPVFLTHSLQDEYTLPDHSRTIAANLDPSRSVLEITNWDSPHAEAVYQRTDEFYAMINDFLQTYVPEYGLSAGR
ncbi:MAG: alpha/beta fold hydrolase [Chloroflexi bacterium]|nr:alpha/beta fold hydrolase [Chloroflexota bacterium]MBP8056352.1 alpha/beta fold hydrolase [Chloroflexota bacterium]